MNTLVKLTKRETEIAELFAWGASKKEIANRLYVSERTVENHTRNIYEKVGCGKVNELSAWWFCTKFSISFSLSPLKQRLVAFAMLLLISPQALYNNEDVVRAVRSNAATRTCRVTRRRSESEVDPMLFDLQA